MSSPAITTAAAPVPASDSAEKVLAPCSHKECSETVSVQPRFAKSALCKAHLAESFAKKGKKPAAVSEKSETSTPALVPSDGGSDKKKSKLGGKKCAKCPKDFVPSHPKQTTCFKCHQKDEIAKRDEEIKLLKSQLAMTQSELETAKKRVDALTGKLLGI